MGVAEVSKWVPLLPPYGIVSGGVCDQSGATLPRISVAISLGFNQYNVNTNDKCKKKMFYKIYYKNSRNISLFADWVFMRMKMAKP